MIQSLGGMGFPEICLFANFMTVADLLLMLRRRYIPFMFHRTTGTRGSTAEKKRFIKLKMLLEIPGEPPAESVPGFKMFIETPELFQNLCY